MVTKTSFVANSKKILIEARPLVTTYVLLYRESIKNKKAVIKKKRKKKKKQGKIRDWQNKVCVCVRMCERAWELERRKWESEYRVSRKETRKIGKNNLGYVSSPECEQKRKRDRMDESRARRKKLLKDMSKRTSNETLASRF